MSGCHYPKGSSAGRKKSTATSVDAAEVMAGAHSAFGRAQRPGRVDALYAPKNKA